MRRRRGAVAAAPCWHGRKSIRDPPLRRDWNCAMRVRLAHVEGRSGGFYGVTSAAGGTYLQGTVYKITSSGTLTALYAFCIQNNCTDGETPRSGLVQGPNGHLY